jgi:P pilus assembly chaperone PapD
MLPSLKKLFSCIAAVCLLFLNLATASAIGIKPLRIELTIDPGNSATATLRVINSEANDLTLKPEVVIYTKNDEKGFPVAEELAANDPANIRSWITFEDSQIELLANSEKAVNFTVTVPKDAAQIGRAHV